MKTSEDKINKQNVLDKIANSLMRWIGSVQSLIVHSMLFFISFLLPIFGLVTFDKMLLVLTTVLSLEAIYLAIFIQMSVNKSSENIEVIRDDVIEIQEDIEDIQEDIEEISEDIDEISDDIDEIQEDLEEINDEDEKVVHSGKAKNVILKSNVSSNKMAIKNLNDKIKELEEQLIVLKKNEFD